MCTYTVTHIHILSTSAHTYLHTSTYKPTHTSTHTYMHTVHIHTYVHTKKHILFNTHTHTYIHSKTHTFTYIPINMPTFILYIVNAYMHPDVPYIEIQVNWSLTALKSQCK